VEALEAEVDEPAGAAPDDPTPLVLAHGFTQTGRLWGDFGHRLAEGRRLVRVDLPGHGRSSEVRAGLAEGGRLLIASGRRHGPDPAGAVDLLGYSLGARFALRGALHEPGAIRRLVLIGATAGIDDPEARSQRRVADEARAAELEGSGDVEGFVDRWLAAPMFAALPAGAAGRAERVTNTAAGLASSLRLAGTGVDPPPWDALGQLASPVLIVVGADDHRFVAAGRRLVDVLPAPTLALVPGAGHAAHLAQPAITARLVGSWLATIP
jgi:2-succinyl-6-hydroxy-2,4-cyclohexadiene-1-carboxylate synthase